jgi:carbamoyltransferase
MITWGISAGGHDAALAVLKDGAVAWAAHSERFSRIKNDPHLHEDLVAAALQHGEPDVMVWHERGWLRRSRELRAGQWRDALARSEIVPLSRAVLGRARKHTVGHHHSHAAAGYYTSGFDAASVLVVDAVGEWDTTTLWQAQGSQLRCTHRATYPNSLGLFYTAMTHRCGFKPNEEEYILMGLAATGDPYKYQSIITDELISMTDTWPFYQCRVNMHRGIRWWRASITDVHNLAAAAQAIFNMVMLRLSHHAAQTNHRNLVLAGGCALNCVANAQIARRGLWDRMWIMPNPGDAGNSLGAALAHHSTPVAWTGPYLGTDIAGAYPINSLLSVLQMNQMVGVANGRAEFGPRALGNRSIFAPATLPDMKQMMNGVKQREGFRPFAPVVKAESAQTYFDLRAVHRQQTSYMQFVAHCRFPLTFPAVCHVDGTSRIQTVSRDQHPGLWTLLDRWEKISGFPILVNTSLNIKGQPLVNSEADAVLFEKTYNIPVFCRD